MAGEINQAEVDSMKLNQTRIKTFLKCGEQYRRRWVEGHIIPPGIAMVRGSGMHKASEHNFKQKVETKVDLPVKEVVEVAVESMRSIIKRDGIVLSEEETSKGKDAVIATAERSLVILASMYSQQVAPKYQPEIVERELEMPVNALLTLHGTLDTRGREIASGKKVILDLKTTKKTPSEGQYDDDPQVTNYWLLDWAETKQEPDEFHLAVLVDKKEPVVVKVVQKRTKDDIEAFVNLATSVASAVEKQVFVPSYGMSDAWWCSKKWCGYWHTCPFVPKGKR